MALEHDPHPRAELARALAGIQAEHAHLARRAVPVTLEDLDRRRLTGAVRTEQAEHLAAPDLEVDPPNSLEFSVGLAQTSHQDCSIVHVEHDVSVPVVDTSRACERF